MKQNYIEKREPKEEKKRERKSTTSQRATESVHVFVIVWVTEIDVQSYARPGKRAESKNKRRRRRRRKRGRQKNRNL